MPKLSSIRLSRRVIADAKPGEFLSDSQLRGFGLRVSSSGAKAFVVSYRLPSGGQRRMVVGSYPTLTADEARKLAAEQLANVASGGDPSGERKAARMASTMADLFRYYAEEYAVARRLKPSTMAMVNGLWRFVQPTLKSKRIRDVTTHDVRRMQGVMEGAHGIYQANRTLSIVSKMFSLAIENEWLERNPCSSVKKFNEDQRWRNLSEEELRKLFDACDSYEYQNPVNAIRLLLYTGARLQEVIKADWSQFDLVAGVWEKPSSHTKTKRQHRLELAGASLELLKRMRQASPDGRYLFPGTPGRNGDGGPLERPRADLKRCWAYVVKAAKLKDVRLHDLRRTTASFMLSDGASLATVGKTLGHTQASTTARYAHLSQEVQRDALKHVGDRMCALMNPQSPDGRSDDHG